MGFERSEWCTGTEERRSFIGLGKKGLVFECFESSEGIIIFTYYFYDTPTLMHIFVVYTESAWQQVEPTWKKVFTVLETLIL